MYEVIITVVTPERWLDDTHTEREPVGTQLFRFEFEHTNAIDASLGWLATNAVSSERLGAVPPHEGEDEVPYVR